MRGPMVRWVIAALLWCWMALGAALAQDAPLDYSSWETTANRAEQSLAAGRASDSSLESLRSDLVDWREEFLRAQSQNQQRIETQQSQIEALGPVPENGEEPDAIANRRAELETQLAELRAPVLRAEEAYSRADGLIREIDATIRARQADELFELGPSPLNPQNLGPAIAALWDSFAGVFHEFRQALSSPAQLAAMRANLPLVLGLLALAIILIWRGPRWAEKAIGRLRRHGPRGTGVFSFLISLGKILLPVAGLYALVEAAFATDIIGVRGTLLFDMLPIWGAAMLFI